MACEESPLRAKYYIMGKLKFLLIILSIIAIAWVCVVFLGSNDGVPVAIDLLFSTFFPVSVGSLVLGSFFLGLVFGATLCLAYVFVQSLELRRARKDANEFKKQLDQLRSLSLKDAL